MSNGVAAVAERCRAVGQAVPTIAQSNVSVFLRRSYNYDALVDSKAKLKAVLGFGLYIDTTTVNAFGGTAAYLNTNDTLPTLVVSNAIANASLPTNYFDYTPGRPLAWVLGETNDYTYGSYNTAHYGWDGIKAVVALCQQTTVDDNIAQADNPTWIYGAIADTTTCDNAKAGAIDDLTEYDDSAESTAYAVLYKGGGTNYGARLLTTYAWWWSMVTWTNKPHTFLWYVRARLRDEVVGGSYTMATNTFDSVSTGLTQDFALYSSESNTLATTNTITIGNIALVPDWPECPGDFESMQSGYRVNRILGDVWVLIDWSFDY